MAEADPLLPSSEPGPGDADDWPARASATIVQYVGTVRDKTTGPALAASRSVVYALTMTLIGVFVAILTLVLLVRFLVAVTAYVPGVDEGETWLAYFVLGGLFVLIGTWLWRKKER